MNGETLIGNIKLERGRAQICASLTGKTCTDLEQELELVRQTPPDIVEWRFDLFASQDADSMVSTLNFIKMKLGTVPLIFTIRTSREGSATEYSDDAYQDLCSAAMDTGLLDAIDLEGTRPEELLHTLISKAQQSHLTTIYSYHNFIETPAESFLEAVIERGKSLDADTVKLAVMPKNQADVLRFMNFSHEMATTIKMPIITISMDTIGTITRVATNVTGSVMTFGVLKQASAPGQIPVNMLRQMLTAMSPSI